MLRPSKHSEPFFSDLLILDSQFFKFTVERRKAQSEQFGSANLVAGRLAERPLDMSFLVKLDRFGEIVFSAEFVNAVLLARQIRRLDPFAIAENHCSF